MATKTTKTYPQLSHEDALPIAIKEGLKAVYSELTGEWLVPSAEIVQTATWHARCDYNFNRTGGMQHRLRHATMDFPAVDAAVKAALVAKGVQS